MTNALAYAKRVAKLIIEGSQAVGKRTNAQQTLMGSLSVMMAANKKDADALDPSIQEIILFGSSAKDDTEPEDLDLMIFDRGFYSNVFLSTNMNRYGLVGRNLSLLMGWFESDETSEDYLAILDGAQVDLLVLPLAFFTDTQKRRSIARQQCDPDFFENAFSAMRRYDASTGEFVGIDLSYFEEKYGVDLSVLRKSSEVPA